MSAPAPQDRTLQSSAEWRKQMAEVDRGVFAALREGVKGGFDEDRFGARIGFGNLKRCAAPACWVGAPRMVLASDAAEGKGAQLQTQSLNAVLSPRDCRRVSSGANTRHCH